MINEDILSQLKTILFNMNNELKFEEFCDILEKETHGQITFTQFKELIEKYYPITNKNDKIFLLKQINLDIKTGLISIYQIFEFIKKKSQIKILNPVLAFYCVSNLIERKMKISTLEFIYKIGLQVDLEINIDQFYKTVTDSLKLDDTDSIIIFKGLDYLKKGKIRIEDFVLVVDSYREDPIEEFQQDDSQAQLKKLKILLEHNYLTVSNIFEKIEMNNLNYVEYGLMMKTLKSELNTNEADEIIKNVLNLIKKEGNKIFREDFESLLSSIQLDPDNLKDTNKVNKFAKINLNDAQLYWINKYSLILEGINLTDKMAFDMAKDSKTSILHLENLKKKLKLVLPIGRLSAVDLNTMIEALDVNKKRFLSLSEYEEIMNAIKQGKNLKETQTIQPLNKSLTNTWVRGSKSVNYHLLPVKGNFKVLANLKQVVVNNIGLSNNNSNGNGNGNGLLNNNNSKKNIKDKTPLTLIKEEELVATQSASIFTNNDNTTDKDKEKGNNLSQVNKYLQELDNEEKDESDLIETFENFTINDPQGIAPSYTLFYYIQTRLSDEDFTRKKISEIIRLIDKNKDGFISYNDIIDYLLNSNKHRSTKLAFKSMASKIQNELKISTEQFFTQNGIDLNTELTITSLCEILYNLFQFENPISKKIYEEMRIIYSTQKPKLSINELIDLIDEFRVEIVERGDKEDSSGKNKSLVLNSREFDESLRNFVLNLIDDNTSSIDLFNMKQNLMKFRENLKCAVKIEKSMNLQQFKDSFVKPLRMDMNLGIAVFQILKNFTLKNEQLISKEDLILFLESYLDLSVNESVVDVSAIVDSLESTGCPLRYVFDNIPYHKDGLVSCVSLINLFERFYPSFNKNIFAKLLPELDGGRNGFINYENLQNFLNENSKKYKFCITLEIKKLASVIDRQVNDDGDDSKTKNIRNCKNSKNIKTALEYFSSLSYPVNNYNSVKRNEHFTLTDRMSTDARLKEELFQSLCQKCGNVNGYDITTLCQMIDSYRDIDNVNLISNGQLEALEEEKLIEVINEINIMLASNKNLNFDKFLENLRLGEKGLISTIEILKNISLNVEKSKLSLLIKSLDSKRTGFISFPDLHNKLKEYFKNKYIGNISINAKFIYLTHIKKNNINNNKEDDDENEIKTFIFSKINKISQKESQFNLTTLLSKDNFSSIFLEYFQNDILLFNQFYLTYGEKGVKNKGMISLQKFYEYIRENNKAYLTRSSSSNSKSNNIDDESDNAVFHLFNEIEENKIPMKNMFDFLNVNLITKDGNIKEQEIRKIFKEKLTVDEDEIEMVIRVFAVAGANEFNLIKFAEYMQINCEKSNIEISSIIVKMKNNIIKFNISQYDQFLKKFSLKKDILINIKDILTGFPPLFKISFYECFILYSDCSNLIKNNYNTNGNGIKINIDFIFNNYKLLEAFKESDNKSENKSEKIDSSLKLSMTKLSEYLDKEKDKMKLFKSFDLDKNGVLSTEEFLKALNSFKDLNMNDSQKVSLIKVADKNKDGQVNCKEFLEFLSYIKFDDGQGKSNDNKTSNMNKGFIPKIEIDLKKLKINYEMNSRKIDAKNCEKLTNYLFILQEDFYNNFSKFENIEQDFNIVDEKTSYCIDKDKFLLVLKKRLLKIDPQIADKMIDFAHESFYIKEKEKYKNELVVNYKYFLLNLVNFRVSTKENESIRAPPGPPPTQDDEDGEDYSNNEPVVTLKNNKKTTTIKKKIVKTVPKKKPAPTYDENIFDDEEEEVVHPVKKVIRPNTSVVINKNTSSVSKKNNKNPTKIVDAEEEDVEVVVAPVKKGKTNAKSNISDNVTKERPKTSTLQAESEIQSNSQHTKKKVPKKISKAKPPETAPEPQYDEFDGAEDLIEQPVVKIKTVNKKIVASKAPIIKKIPNKKIVEKTIEYYDNNDYDNNNNNNNNDDDDEIQFKEEVKKITKKIPNKKDNTTVVKQNVNEMPAQIDEEIEDISNTKDQLNGGKKNVIPMKSKLKEKDNPKRSSLEKTNFLKGQAIGKVFSNNLGTNFDVDHVDEIKKAQNKMTCLFSCKTDHNLGANLSDVSKAPISNESKQDFKEFLSKLNNLDYQGYDYTIDPQVDYFQRLDGSLVSTILNSEDAAIKKCEELYNSIKDSDKYFDKDFGSQPNDKGVLNKFSIYLNGAPSKGGVDPNLIEWYRMSEISRDTPPVFVDDGVETNDVQQGALGDCWFISALSVLATKDHLLRGEFNESILHDGLVDDEDNVMLSTGVYPPIFHGFRSKNIFCLRFFKNFKWRYVIIDDRLPCKKIFNDVQIPKLIYGKCRNEWEFWVPLIEKAYAKLHGSYESLISGFIDDGLVDVTSYVARKYVISQEEKTSVEKSDALWQLILTNSNLQFNQNKKIVDQKGKKMTAKVFTRNNTMMGCSVDAKVVESEVVYLNRKCGILAGHAYGILDAFEIPKPEGKKRKTSRLLRIRNPWGFKEWIGKWNDESEEIEKNKNKLEIVLRERYSGTNEKIVLDREDGTFIMSYFDFRNVFSKLFICYDFPPSVVGVRYHDKWTKEQSGGLPLNNTSKEFTSFAKNPQFYLKLEKDASVYICLMQNDGRLSRTKFPYAEHTRKACLIIAKAKGGVRMETFDNDLMIEISPVRQHREISILRNLPKGEYLIIPSIMKEGDVGDFCLEVYFPDALTKTKIKYGEFYDDVNKYLTVNKFQKLGMKAKCELISDARADEIESVNEMKKTFIYSQFQNMLRDSDNVDYGDQNGKKNSKHNNDNRKNKNKQAEEDDWDEY